MSLRADSATPALCASTSASGLAAEPAEGEEEGEACAGVRSKRRRRSLLTQRRPRHLTRPPHASRSPLSVDLTPLRLLLLLLGCLSTAAGLVVPAPQAFFQPKLIATHGGRSRLQVGPPLSVCLPSPQLTAALGLSSLLEKTCLLGAGALPDLWAKSPSRVEVVRSLFGRRHFFEHYAEQPALFAPLDTLSSVVCRAVFPLRYHLVREWHASRVHSAGLVLRRSKAELSRALASELRADVASLVHLTTRVKSAMSIFEKSVLRGKLVTDLLGMRLVGGR
ncbi:hypothetical protein AB1Y20_007598 [Prymnesium parvum]|uniref:Uncharacterized protein n=1 Tax=Prymnesium parvum TaxID=97485 RepID=A0AB34IXE5_PRYPA